MKHSFGITLEQYNDIAKSQDKKCAICKEPETAILRWGKVVNLAVDHCHKTGKVRGLLCRRCNQCLGKLDDNIALLKAAITYLEG